MADIGGVFNVLLTINNNDRQIADITANAGVTWSPGARLLVAGNFNFFMAGPITTTPTGPPGIMESELSNPNQEAYLGIRFDNVTAGSKFENMVLRHAANLTWGSALAADNIVVNNIILERGRSRFQLSNVVAINIGQILRRDGATATAINFLPTADVTIERFTDINSSGTTSGKFWISLNSNSKLRIDELIMDGTTSDFPLFKKEGLAPTLDIGRIFMNSQQIGDVFSNFDTGTLQIGGGIMTVAKNRICIFCLGAQNLIQGVDYYNHGDVDFHVQGPPENNCAYHGARNKSIEGFNFIANTGTPNGVNDVTTPPFNQDSISGVRVTDNYPETAPVIVLVTPGDNSVSVDFTIRAPGESTLIISDSVTPLVVNSEGDLAQYDSASILDYTQIIDQAGNGKTITSNIETGNRNISGDAVKGGSLLRGRIVHKLFRNSQRLFSSEFTFTPTVAGDTINPTWDDGGPGTDSGLAAIDPTTSGEMDLSWNAPLDETDIEGVQLFFSTVSFVQAITDGVKRIIPANVTAIRLGGLIDDTQHFFIVRALDKAGNTTNETTGVTATPTATTSIIPVPGAVQSFLILDQ